MLRELLPYIFLYGHVQSGLEVCGGWSGGGGSEASCQAWDGGQWSPAHQLSQERLQASVWHSSLGPVILAGSETLTGTEKLEADGSVTQDYFHLDFSME